MSIIQKAIENKWNISGVDQVDCQSWETFSKTTQGKKLFIFGVGNATDYFLIKYGECFDIFGIIDNDPLKIGRCLKELSFYQGASSDLKIYSESELDYYRQDELVVLILSIKRYLEIHNNLDVRGYKNVFSFIVMESKTDKRTWIDTERLEKEYILTKIRECPIKSNKIAVHSMGRIADHAKYVIDRCKKISSDLEIYWIVNKIPEQYEEGICFVPKDNRKAVIDATIDARIWLDDYLGAFWMEKRPGQIMIELKHWSSITLKTFGLTLERGRNIKSNIDICLEIAKKIDYVVVGSEFDKETCQAGFGVDDNYIKLGSSRTDVLFDEKELQSKLKKSLNIPVEARVLLYAPTFRTNSHIDDKGDRTIESFYSKHSELDYEAVKNSLEKKYGGKWKIILRLHPVISNMSANQQLPEYVMDCSDYLDSQELILISDMVITDYSSIMFEPAYVLKPVLLFATDLDDYLRYERELLIDYKELPFPIAKSNLELSEIIETFNYEEYKNVLSVFFRRYGINEDGHASERVALFINDIVNNQVKEHSFYEQYLRS